MTAFEIRAQDLIDLLVPTIPLASDSTYLAISSVLLARRGDYLTALATDRHVMGMRRVLVNSALPAPDDGWKFALSLKDAKELLKDARGALRAAPRGPTTFWARARLSAPGGGILLRHPTDAPVVTYVEQLTKGGDRYPVERILKILRSTLRTVRSVPQVPGGLDPRLVGKFSAAMKQSTEFPAWWDATPDDGVDGWNTFALKIGPDFVGLVMGMRSSVDGPAVTDVSDWDEVL